MNIFIDVLEILPESSDLTPENMRIEITDYNASLVDSIVEDIKEVMAGKSFRIDKHFCNHPDGQCKTEFIYQT